MPVCLCLCLCVCACVCVYKLFQEEKWAWAFCFENAELLLRSISFASWYTKTIPSHVTEQNRSNAIVFDASNGVQCVYLFNRNCIPGSCFRWWFFVRIPGPTKQLMSVCTEEETKEGKNQLCVSLFNILYDRHSSIENQLIKLTRIQIRSLCIYIMLCLYKNIYLISNHDFKLSLVFVVLQTQRKKNHFIVLNLIRKIEKCIKSLLCRQNSFDTHIIFHEVKGIVSGWPLNFSLSLSFDSFFSYLISITGFSLLHGISTFIYSAWIVDNYSIYHCIAFDAPLWTLAWPE